MVVYVCRGEFLPRESKMADNGTLIFKGIDSWNRPVFKDTVSGLFYGSLDKLFTYVAPIEYVLADVTEKDLCLFGREFDCEPEGFPLPEGLKIQKN